MRTLEMADMLDVAHVLYEEDITPLYEDHQKVKSQVRVAMWQHLLDKDYKYKYTESENVEPPDALPIEGGRRVGKLGPNEDLLPPELPADNKEVKPYFPPTDPTQLTELGLDGPMGGF